MEALIWFAVIYSAWILIGCVVVAYAKYKIESAGISSNDRLDVDRFFILFWPVIVCVMVYGYLTSAVSVKDELK